MRWSTVRTSVSWIESFPKISKKPCNIFQQCSCLRMNMDTTAVKAVTSSGELCPNRPPSLHAAAMPSTSSGCTFGDNMCCRIFVSFERVRVPVFASAFFLKSFSKDAMSLARSGLIMALCPSSMKSSFVRAGDSEKSLSGVYCASSATLNTPANMSASGTSLLASSLVPLEVPEAYVRKAISRSFCSMAGSGGNVPASPSTGV
mmetsp:Transcript_25527/g.59403  ORF Transcript_25527/g.59403 Transcript_25527/m.59403 type:complete len:203 (-) Transcript_25527:269-877(-)